MHVENKTTYCTERLTELLRFAMGHSKDDRVKVQVSETIEDFGGRASELVPLGTPGASGPVFPVIMRLPRRQSAGPCRVRSAVPDISAWWPDGFPIDVWEDLVILLAAHEFRHIWQFQSKWRAGPQWSAEHDAEAYGYQRLNEWRLRTGRVAVPAVVPHRHIGGAARPLPGAAVPPSHATPETGKECNSWGGRTSERSRR
jgi:hypothetical protein